MFMSAQLQLKLSIFKYLDRQKFDINAQIHVFSGNEVKRKGIQSNYLTVLQFGSKVVRTEVP